MVLCFRFEMKIAIITHTDILVVAEQSLHRVKEFSASHSVLPEKNLRVHKKLRGNGARIADLRQ